ncbi:MAG TPA: hypothetical protein VJ813_03125 [Vicinamibacterales bacterium]|nr:hypothetical protein [Vicinamibacterales bacterium]
MTGLVVGVAILVSSAGAPPAPELPRPAVASAIFSFELPERVSRDLPRGLLWESSGPPRERGLVRAQAPSAKRSKVDQIIAVAAGASIGWVVGGGIGFAVTPKRGPYDDTSGLKGMIIGAPIGGLAGALIGYRLTK